MRRTTFALISTLGLASLVSVARAHPITVDGDPGDWLSRTPATANLAIVARGSSERGALVWTDAGGDARTDLGDPAQVDLRTFAVTADATNIYFRIDVAGSFATIDPNLAPQIQIAIDLDRAAVSGERFFAAFADTTVADDARWERLVRTRMELEPRVEVLDTFFGVAGTGVIAASSSSTGTTLEIGVPWSALGLSAPPAALRLTVATFRENVATGLTVDIGGPGVSNALDVVSHGGAPSTTVFPSSWEQELMDAHVDHSLEVFFEADGDVRAPLAITRIVQSATQVEWVEVRNVTSVSLDLSLYRLGDEETPRDPATPAEGMFSFPPGTVLTPGEGFIAARQGTPFFTAYGVRADAEFVANDVMTPEMVRDTVWSFAGGSFDLATFDHVVVLGPHYTIVDLVHFGSSLPYPGIGSLSETPTDRVASRVRDDLDTDTGGDFVITPDCRLTAPCTGVCRSCVRLACLPTPPGGACEDGDLCTMGETCTDAGSCVGGVPRVCDDANTCTSDACVTATGCVYTPTPGLACDDGSACTTGDACSAAGVCAGAPVSCDDENPCTADACGADGACVHTPTPGIACGSASVCDGGDTCDATGACVAGTPLDCDDGNPCTLDSCDPALGCEHEPDDGASCDDGSACTTDDACNDEGACEGSPVSGCDAGVIDAGVFEDAAVSLDGAVTLDAGRSDASVRRDAGTSDGGAEPAPVGCSCRASGGTSRSALALLAALALAIAWRRRRA